MPAPPNDGFHAPRIAAIYDPFDPDRSDLDVYADLAVAVGAGAVIDVGCGTGDLACRLARLGHDVIGVDPSLAMLDVAKRKPGAERVRWIHGVAADLPDVRVDLVTMTANVAQHIVSDEAWDATLVASRRVLPPGGHLVFETRRPEVEAWLQWNRYQSYQRLDVDGVGVVESWEDLIVVDLPLVTFRSTTVFHADGEVLTSESTLRFRSEEEVRRSLAHAGFEVGDVRDAPDRPGRELVFLARRRP